MSSLSPRPSRASQRRLLSAALVLVALLASGAVEPVGATPARPAWPAGAVDMEARFVADINSVRSGRGLPPLRVNENLVHKARGWAATMAASRRIWHSTVQRGITANWHKLGENVGMGMSEAGLQSAFVASPRHFENLVDPAFGQVGIGVVETGTVVFVSEVFMEVTAGGPPVRVGTPPHPAPRGIPPVPMRTAPVAGARPPYLFRSVG